ncbi:MAG: hypothetical protein M5U34_24995 [Chloroflexi bacterium]|nr:hypothetical protein [Chloroflexota bacterium]
MMRKEMKGLWRLLVSVLAFATFLSLALWLMTGLTVQASPNELSREVWHELPQDRLPTAVSAASFCVTGDFNGWDNGGQPMYDDGTHGDIAAGDGVYSFAYTYASAGLQEWKVVECGTWTGFPAAATPGYTPAPPTRK